jgi:cytochrome P450
MSSEHLLEVSVLVALAWPTLRAASSSAYRRVFPYDAVGLGLATGLYLAVVAALAIYAPRALRIPAVAATSIGAILLWRSRPGYGVSSGLPPGSLAPLPVQPWSDPEFYKLQALRHGPVFKVSQFGQPTVCLVGLNRANRLLREHDEQLVAPPLPFSRFIEGGYLRYLPEQTHDRYRRTFRALFHSEAATAAEPSLTDVFRRGLAAMAEHSAREGAVLVKPAVMRMMFEAWTTLFYGIDGRHEDFPRLQALCRVIDIRKARWASRRRVGAALLEIEAILRRRAASLASVGEGAPSCFLAALVRADPDALADRTILGNFIYIMQVSWGDVAGLLVWVVKNLGDHPAWRDRLEDAVASPERRGRDLATRIVQETLRLEQSEHRYRRATAAFDLDGFRIPKGWLVRMCIRESHQDPEVFPNPAVFDPDRFLDRRLARDQYAPFGAFRLACIGEELTKAVGSLFAVVLVSEVTWRVVADGPAQVDSFAHNAPSARFSVRLTERTKQGRDMRSSSVHGPIE